MKQRRVRANPKNPTRLSKGDAREAERIEDVDARALHKMSAEDEDFKVIYEYMDSGDEDERLYELLCLLLSPKELIEIISKTRDDSK